MARLDDFDPQNPFAEEAPKIIHFEKDESHYEYCRMQMHEIERIHRRTFVANMVLCILVCFLSIFSVYIQCFSFLSAGFLRAEGAGAVLTCGIFQILVAMAVIIAGYLAWANYHTLNIFLITWYGLVTAMGIFKLDYISALIGVVGVCFYFFSMQAMNREGALSAMEGYPDFQEQFDINKSDIVIQTLLAHRGEQRVQPSFFNGSTSLRKKKRKSAPKVTENATPSSEKLAQELTEKLAEKQRRDAEAEVSAAAEVAAASTTESPAEIAAVQAATAQAQTDAAASAVAASVATEEEPSAAEAAAPPTGAKPTTSTPHPPKKKRKKRR